MTSYPNGYDLRFLLPKDYEYDPAFLNTLSRSYFMALYGSAIENRLTLRYDIQQFLTDMITTTLLCQQEVEGSSRSTVFFKRLYMIELPPHVAPTYVSNNTSINLVEKFRLNRALAYADWDGEQRNWVKLGNYLDVVVTHFLDQLFRPEKTHIDHYVKVETAGKVLLERLFAMRMGEDAHAV